MPMFGKVGAFVDNYKEKKRFPTVHSHRCFNMTIVETGHLSIKGQQQNIDVQQIEAIQPHLPYKRRFPLCCRQSEYRYYRQRYPDKVPMIIERSLNEKILSPLPKSIFVLPSGTTVGHLQIILRQRMDVDLREVSLYLIVHNRELPSIRCTVDEMAVKFRSDDGFVYLSYSSQEVAG